MNQLSSISVVLLTYNEAKHLPRCLDSLRQISDDIHVIDSYSTDDTVQIAESYGAKVLQNKFVNYAIQFKWGLDHCEPRNPWVMRMDADEYLEPGLIREIHERMSSLDPEVSGIFLKRKVFFKGKWIRHGGFYPHVLLRIWRNGSAAIEQRWMDEHMVLDHGRSIVFKEHVVDYNLNSIHWWVNKHNNYAVREMVDLLNLKYQLIQGDQRMLVGETSQAKRKRLLKEKWYASLSPGLRAFSYFVYRYFIRLGILDGFYGFVFHFMQGFWYRLLVDMNVLEFEKKIQADPSRENVIRVLRTDYRIEL